MAKFLMAAQETIIYQLLFSHEKSYIFSNFEPVSYSILEGKLTWMPHGRQML